MIADLCHQGDNIHVLYRDSECYYGIKYGNLYLASSTDAGRTFNSQLISVPLKIGSEDFFCLTFYL